MEEHTTSDRPLTRSRERWRGLLAWALLALLVGSLIANGGLSTLAQEEEGTPDSGSTVLADDGRSIADVVEEANRAVVTVRATIDVDTVFGDDFGPGGPGGDPFGRPPVYEVVPTSSGSGFIVDAAGHVVTNNHVVAGATEFEVELYDETVVPASLVGTDPFTDVAVLQLDLADGQEVPGTLPLGDSDAVRVGDQVIAIGTPLGEYTNTVSAGIVGAKDRSIDTGNGYLLDGLIQHDAPVYQGSSGGPLLNMAGEVIGINTAKAASRLINAGATDIGFAIAINEVKDVIADLIANGEVARPYLGIEGRPLVDGGHGVLAVAPDSPAEAAGLERGDIITAVDGQEVDAEHPLANLLLDRAPGDEVTLTIDRDGQSSEVTVTLGERPSNAA